MTAPTIAILRHTPDPVDMERYWKWYCTCGDVSDSEFASWEDADDDAVQHTCPKDFNEERRNS